MRKRLAAGAVLVAAAAVMALCGDSTIVAQDKAPPKKASEKFLYGYDFKVRTGGKFDFDKDTPKLGVEVYQSDDTNSILAISELGALSVVPAGPISAEPKMKWLTGFDLSVRKVGEPEFTQKTKKFGLELYRDLGSNHLLYICNSGSVAFAPVPGGLVTDRGPAWDHAFNFSVRTGEQIAFDNARKFGVEVSRDENTGGLIYITETGSIATAAAPAAPTDPKKIAPPKTAYGLILKVRNAGEPDFSSKTKEMSVEVFEDPNANNALVYLSETGSIAVVPNPGKLSEQKSVTWKTVMTFKVRKSGDKTFDASTRYRVEVFVDNRTGNLIFIDDTGAIAVLPKNQ